MDQKPEVSEQRDNGEEASVAARRAERREFYGEEWEAIRAGKISKEKYADTHTESDFEKERLEKRVTTDSLVESVSSHGHFLVLLQEEVEATQRMQEPSSFLLTLDLDHFGETDEMLGHPTADQLLITVGETIVDAIRPGDSPGRTGGDEFSVIVRRTDHVGAIIVAKRIRKTLIERTGEKFQQKGFSQTVSIGLCMIPKGLSVQEIRDIADAALYTVKNSGRNQIAEGSLNPQTGSIETFIVPSESTSAHR